MLRKHWSKETKDSIKKSVFPMYGARALRKREHGFVLLAWLFY